MVVKFDGAAAEELERSYRGHDIAAQRTVTLDRLAVRPGERVLDIGAGPGFLASEIAEQTGPDGRVVGVDISRDLVRRATERNDHAWVSYLQGEATALPVEADSFDIAVSTQVAEYMPDLAPYCGEIARVLKPGGRALILTTDWDGMAWHSDDPGRMRRVLSAMATSVAQSNVPRLLAPHLRAAGLAIENVSCHQIINLDRRPGNYSTGMVEFTTEYVRDQGTLPEAELQDWAAEQDALEQDGRYFFSLGRYIFEARMPG